MSNEAVADAVKQAVETKPDDAAIVAALATLDDLAYERAREETAKKLGLKPARLDRLVAKNKKHAPRTRNGVNTRTGYAQTPGGEGLQGCSTTRSNTPPVLTRAQIEQLYESARSLIEAPDVLEKVKSVVVDELGFAGNPGAPLLTYTALTSRLLDKPINLQIVAPSGAGKNHAVNTALTLLPEEAVFKMTASSPKALIYSDEDLRHKTIVMGECDSLTNLEGNAASLLRAVIEDARTDFDTVEKDPETGSFVTRRVSKEGPTGLITTGVRELEFQLSTRILTVHLSDTPAQTRAILAAEAAIADGRAVAPNAETIGKFQDFQRWLAAQPSSKVIVPFARILAEKVPDREVRMRRDFKQLIAVIKAVALLNQHHRQRDRAGNIIAEKSDYQWARELLLESFKSSTSGGITDAVRQTCGAIPENEEASEVDLARRLNLSKTAVHYRVRRALRGGWLQNLENRKGYPYRLVRGAPLPEDGSPLPTVEELEDESPLERLDDRGEITNGSRIQEEQRWGVDQDGNPVEVEIE